MPHHCHARACKTPVRPELLMCRRHWGMVTPRLQRAVWATYRPGQCDDKRPSKDWHKAADAAIGYVASLEHRAMRVCEVTALREAGYETTTDEDGFLLVRRTAPSRG